MNKWSEVFDFNNNAQEKHWSILPPHEFPALVVKSIEGFPEPPRNPVVLPLAYGGTDPSHVVVGSRDQGGESTDFSQLMGKAAVSRLMEEGATVEHSI